MSQAVIAQALLSRSGVAESTPARASTRRRSSRPGVRALVCDHTDGESDLTSYARAFRLTSGGAAVHIGSIAADQGGFLRRMRR
ncbi:hypothetical protein [Streptomyces sp. NPDC003006]